MTYTRCATFVVAAAMCAGSPGASAQTNSVAKIAAAAKVDPATIEMPVLAFEASPADVENYWKYFYFHKANVSFDTALEDLIECDQLASGISYRTAYQPTPYPYMGTVGGIVGGAIGNVMADAIFGSAERRNQRRINLRKCMGFKGYARHGLTKKLWDDFHFEEGNNKLTGEERVPYLIKQAKVASGPAPTTEALAL